jgi:serine/threonine protein kinase/tetratricopeptide (TPR) repeat protein
MIGQTISHYRILEKLGAGGMGIVYRAHDEKLNRDIALKVLRTEPANSDDRSQLLRKEALALSRLNHPNIAQIYDFDQFKGVEYLVMEFVRGETLAASLINGPIPERETIGIGIQLASALEAAAEVGVVHCDLKPSNVMLSATGNVKVLDFGLAKLLKLDSEDTRSFSDALGEIGTMPYTAPEQFRGEIVDFRTDIYSLGVLLYESSTGKRPFRGTNSANLISDILSKSPDAPSKIRPNISVGMDAIILRCLAKEPARRYQRASEVKVALEAIAIATEPTSALGSRKNWRRLLPILLPLAVIASLFLVLIPHRLRHTPPEKVGTKRVNQLAILPLTLSSLDNDMVAFSNGLIETLTSRLTKLTSKHPLQVVPASEVRAFGVTSLEQAKQQFGANLGLELNIEKSGGLVRVNYALVDANQHNQLRGDTITAPASDPFGLEDKVADSVVGSLKIELSPDEQAALTDNGTSQPGAFDYYLQGRGYLQDFQKPENIDSAITEFNQALAQDPNYALAYAGLGEAFWYKYHYTRDREWVDKAQAACERGVSLRADEAAPHVCLGLVFLGTGNYEKSAHEYQLAVAIEPTDDKAYNGLAIAYSRLNEPVKAEETFKSAIQVRPNYWAGYNWLGELYLRQGKSKDAETMFSEVISLVPDSFVGYTNLGSTYLNDGRYAEAIPLLKRSVEIRQTAENSSNLATAYFGMRQFDNAAKTYERAVKLDSSNYEVWGNLADAYYWDGKHQLSMAAYRKAIRLGEEQLAVNPRNSNLLGYLAGYFAMTGDRQRSLAYLTQALEISPSDPNILLDAAEVHNQLGEKDLAIQWCTKAIAAGISSSALRDTPIFDNLRDDLRFKRLVGFN